MQKLSWAGLALAAILPLAAFAAESPLPKADRDPTAPTLEQKILIRDGVAPHDRGDFDGAIAKYQAGARRQSR